MKTSVRDQVNALSAAEYFTLLADLMKTNPPAAKDAPVLERFKDIGLVAGQNFDPKAIDARWAKRLPALSFDRIMLHFKFSDGDVKDVNGWGYTIKAGLYGTDYLQRALITAIGLVPIVRRMPSIRPRSRTRTATTILVRTSTSSASGRSVPPVKGFWSLTMYDENYFFVANPIKPLLDECSLQPGL